MKKSIVKKEVSLNENIKDALKIIKEAKSSIKENKDSRSIRECECFDQAIKALGYADRLHSNPNEEILGFKEITEDGYDGFSIVTDRQQIKLLISNYQSCCENWGYFMSNDDLPSFVGAYILGVEITDTALNTEKIYDLDFTYGGDTMFVNINTDKGMLQFVAYNSHNGYYGHEAKVVCRQLQHKCSL